MTDEPIDIGVLGYRFTGTTVLLRGTSSLAGFARSLRGAPACKTLDGKRPLARPTEDSLRSSPVLSFAPLTRTPASLAAGIPEVTTA